MIEPTNRHHRQRILPQIGDTGQDRLRAGHAIIVGVGALGTHLADTLCRAGVGRLTLIDRDIVEWTNLQRQILFTEDDARAGAPKAIAASRALAHIDAQCRVEALVDDLTADSARRLLPEVFSSVTDDGRDARPTGSVDDGRDGATVLLDGTDNFQTRFLLNDVAVLSGVPLVYAGVVGTVGLMTPILPATPASQTPAEAQSIGSPWLPTPCLRCLFDAPPAAGSAPTCDTAGVLGPAVSIIAGFQAVEAIKILIGAVGAITRALMEIDAWTGAVRRVDTADARLSGCPCCDRRRFEFLETSSGDGATILCGADAVQITPEHDAGLDLPALAQRLAPVADVVATEHLLRGALQDGGVNLTVFPTGRAILRGVTDPARARALYARYIGA